MEHRVRSWKAAVSAAVGVLTAVWGWFGWLVIAWFGCMALDIATGMAAGARRGEWSSKLAREGLWHKAGCVAAVTVCGVLDLVVGQLLRGLPQGSLPFEYDVLLCPMMVMWYLLTEVGSVIENAGRMGAPIPAWVSRMIAELRGKLGT